MVAAAPEGRVASALLADRASAAKADRVSATDSAWAQAPVTGRGSAQAMDWALVLATDRVGVRGPTEPVTTWFLRGP